MKPTEDQLASIEQQFSEQFRKNVASAYRSGALPDDADPGIVVKAVAYITAQQLRPMSNEGKQIVKNIEHFI